MWRGSSSALLCGSLMIHQIPCRRSASPPLPFPHLPNPLRRRLRKPRPQGRPCPGRDRHQCTAGSSSRSTELMHPSPPRTSCIMSIRTASTARPSTARCTCPIRRKRWRSDPGRNHHRRAQALSADHARADVGDRAPQRRWRDLHGQRRTRHGARRLLHSLLGHAGARRRRPRRRPQWLCRLRSRHRWHGRCEKDLGARPYPRRRARVR